MEHEAKPLKTVKYMTHPSNDFEEVYMRVREKENRWLSDELVKQLPFLPSSHPHCREWKKRADSLKRIQKKLKKLGKIGNLLEIGCGNGWFAHQLIHCASEIDAIDIGRNELEQAARCFQNQQLQFICCDNLSLLDNEKYDIIIFNASLQYFDLTEILWSIISKKLTATGKIIVMDSPIYDEQQLAFAQKRTHNYFENLNESLASSYYKHLTWSKLPQHQVLFKPSIFGKLFNFTQSPFPILEISKNYI